MHNNWGSPFNLGLKLADPADELDEGGGILWHTMVRPHSVVEVPHYQVSGFRLLLLHGLG